MRAICSGVGLQTMGSGLLIRAFNAEEARRESLSRLKGTTGLCGALEEEGVREPWDREYRRSEGRTDMRVRTSRGRGRSEAHGGERAGPQTQFGARRSRWSVLAWLALWAVLGTLGGWAPPSARADDVPDEIRKHYDEAVEHVADGDWKEAYSALSRARTRNPDSVDFWMLYVKVWRALEKDEEVLWDKVVARQIDAEPDSATIHLLKARLADTPEERIEHLSAAIVLCPDDPGPRLRLARVYARQGDDFEAEEILAKILEADPAHEDALVLKGDMMITSGFSRSAVEFAEETLAEHDLPALHDLHARALLEVAENDATVLDTAIAEAQKAVAGRPDAAFVLTAVEAMERAGKDDDAIALLKAQQSEHPSAELAARLGVLAFGRGAYADAVPGLAAGAADDPIVARALALAHARLGKEKEARAVLNRLPAADEGVPVFAARVELLLGDPAAALKRLGSDEGEEARRLRSRALGRSGDVDGVLALAREEAASGTREGEEWLLDVARAQLVRKLGGKAGQVLQTIDRARREAAQAGTPSAEIPDTEPSVNAKSMAFMYRYVTYRRSLCGGWFTAAQDALTFTITFENEQPVRRRWTASIPARQTSWWPQRSSKSAWTYRTRRSW